MSAAHVETYTLPAGSHQRTLFPASPLSRSTDPQTSRDAGEAHAPTGTYSVLQRRILDAFHSEWWEAKRAKHDPHGFTCDELVRYLTDAYTWEHPPHGPTIGKRITELVQSGDLEAGRLSDLSPETRLSDRGRPMTVWRLTPLTPPD